MVSPLLSQYMPTQIGARVQAFYNHTPFPDYELNKFESKQDLVAAASAFGPILDRSIPADASVIDVGTGTGQLAALLSLRRSTVWGVDFSDTSLAKAVALKKKLGLDSLTLRKLDILDPAQVDGIGRQFDYLLCLGVLHHTGDARQAFRNVLHLLKPGGFLAIGLYHSLGRLPLYARQFLARHVFKGNPKIKEAFIRQQLPVLREAQRTESWWLDQYCHPHETTHTLGEVLRWFKENDVEFLQTLPSSTPFDRTNYEVTGVWNNANQIYPFTPLRQLIELGWIFETGHEGGYWITFGRKKPAAP